MEKPFFASRIRNWFTKRIPLRVNEGELLIVERKSQLSSLDDFVQSYRDDDILDVAVNTVNRECVSEDI